MIRWLVETINVRAEQMTGESADYLRDLAGSSLGAYLKFLMILPLNSHRSNASVEALAVARIVATRHEDCGPCLGITIRQAQESGVSEAVIECAARARPAELSETLALVYRFTESVVERQPTAQELARRVRDAFGQAALVDLALGIATVRVFPTLKRGLGRTGSCDIHSGTTSSASIS